MEDTARSLIIYLLISCNVDTVIDGATSTQMGDN